MMRQQSLNVTGIEQRGVSVLQSLLHCHRSGPAGQVFRPQWLVGVLQHRGEGQEGVRSQPGEPGQHPHPGHHHQVPLSEGGEVGHSQGGVRGLSVAGSQLAIPGFRVTFLIHLVCVSSARTLTKCCVRYCSVGLACCQESSHCISCQPLEGLTLYSSMFQEQNDLEIKIWIKDNEGEVKVIPHLRRAIRFDV